MLTHIHSQTLTMKSFSLKDTPIPWVHHDRSDFWRNKVLQVCPVHLFYLTTPFVTLSWIVAFLINVCGKCRLYCNRDCCKIQALYEDEKQEGGSTNETFILGHGYGRYKSFQKEVLSVDSGVRPIQNQQLTIPEL